MPHHAKALLPAALLAACGLKPSDTPKPPPQPGSISYQLSCSSPLGSLKTWVTYTVFASEEPVTSAAAASYRISAPPAAVESPWETRFVSSRVVYPLPVGLRVDTLAVEPAVTSTITSASATLLADSFVVEQEGDFPLDGGDHDLPFVLVRGEVTAAPGETVELLTPLSVVGTADTGIFGTHTSTCSVIAPGPIWTSSVE